MGRPARGVRGIRLKPDDYVIGACCVDYNKKMIVVTENGIGKRVEFSNFMAHARGSSGALCYKYDEKIGPLAKMAETSDDDDILLITNEGTVIRTKVEQIPIYSNYAKGVIIMRLKEGEKVVNFTTVKSLEKEEEEIDLSIIT